MCKQCNDPFHGLDDDLSDLLGETTASHANFPQQSGSHVPLTRDGSLANALIDRVVGVTHETRAAAAGHRYDEKCPDCKGTGRFYSYTGRLVGNCFKCKGKGTVTFKTSPEARAAAAVARDRKADQKRIDLQAARQKWINDNRDDWTWIQAKSETFEFATAMHDAVIAFGTLTERQHATVTRLRLADAARNEARKVEAAERAANAPAVDIAKLEQAFAAAVSNGLKRPKVTLAGYKFSLAPATGRNAGALYVVRKGDDQYLGKIAAGKFSRVRECSAAEESEIVAVAADPHNAAIAYGQRNGVCACCGRNLTKHTSIDLGIGPICASKYGWA